MAKNISVFGIYPDRTTVSDAIDALHQASYRNADIAVLLPDNSGSQDFAHQKRTKALEGAAVGGAVCALVGAALAWLIASGLLTLPGLEPLAAVPTAIAVLAGAGAAAIPGFLAGVLAGLTKPEYVARRYSGRLRRGAILLSVHCDDSSWCPQARTTLKNTGAQNISSAPEASGDFLPTDRPIHRIPSGRRDRQRSA